MDATTVAPVLNRGANVETIYHIAVLLEFLFLVILHTQFNN